MVTDLVSRRPGLFHRQLLILVPELRAPRICASGLTLDQSLVVAESCGPDPFENAIKRSGERSRGNQSKKERGNGN